MPKLKTVLVTLLVLPVLIVGASVAFILTLDPNRLKPLITDAASKQGLSVEITGDIGWRLYPNIGIDVAGIGIANQTTREPLASLKSARLDVALKPLLQRKIEVVGVAIDGAEVSYLLNAAGESNWPVVSQANTPTASAPSGDAPELNIAELFVSDLTLNYQDTLGVATNIEGLNAEALGLNLTGRAFDLTLQTGIKHAGYPEIWLESTGSIALDLGLDEAVLDAFNTAVYVGGRKLSRSPDGTLELAAVVNWHSVLSVKSTLSMEADNMRQLLAKLSIELPATQDPQAFKALSVAAALNVNGDLLALDNVVLKLDQTTMQAQLAIKDFEQPSIQAQLEIDRINADSYMAPALNKAKPKASKSDDEPAAPIPIPFDLLRALKLNIGLSIGQLQVNAITLQDINTKVSASEGLVTLKPFGLTIAEGTVKAEGVLDARVNPKHKVAQAKVDGWLATEGIELAALLEQLKQEPLLAGALGSRIAFTSEGRSDQEISKNLQATMSVDSASIKLTTINIEKSFCEAVGLLSGKPMTDAQWPSYSELAPLSLKASYANDKVKLQSLNADIQKLKASSYGELDLASGDFRFPLDVSLADFSGGLQGCTAVDEKWRKRTIPLRCKGNLINIGAKTCLPDGPRIREALKDKAEQKIAERIDKAQDKVEEKAKKEADRFLEKHIDKDKVDALKDSVKGLFKFK